MRWAVLLAGAALLWAPPLPAQSQPLDSAAVAALKRVLRLPQTTTEAREEGVRDSIIRIILTEARRRGIPAGDAQQAVEIETDAVRAGAPKDNFGAFVQAHLAAGKRGRELAEAIRAEHAKRGHVKETGAAGHEHGGPPDANRPGARGRRGMPDSTATADSARRRGGRQ